MQFTLNFFEQFNWSDRLLHSRQLIEGSYCSVDGTDCRILEPQPFSTMWYSHKFSGPGLRYEIGLSHNSGNIVWVYGPFPCGKWPDIKIFNSKMCTLLQDGEKVVADNGYTSERCITPDSVRDSDKKVHTRLRARHESCNARIKSFGILKHTYRHSLSSHNVVFHAVSKLVALTIETEEPLFSI